MVTNKHKYLFHHKFTQVFQKQKMVLQDWLSKLKGLKVAKWRKDECRMMMDEGWCCQAVEEFLWLTVNVELLLQLKISCFRKFISLLWSLTIAHHFPNNEHQLHFICQTQLPSGCSFNKLTLHNIHTNAL